jgi:hypothetical protein
MAIFEDDYKPPESETGDRAMAVVRSTLGAVPIIGAAAQELLDHVIRPPLVRRQQEWMEDIAGGLRKLEADHGIRPEQLRDNRAFVDAVLSATQAAIRTSQHEKKKALRNAVLNAGLPGAPEVALQQMFISLVDRFSDWHLRILQLFKDPQRHWSGEPPPASVMLSKTPFQNSAVSASFTT